MLDNDLDVLVKIHIESSRQLLAEQINKHISEKDFSHGRSECTPNTVRKNQDEHT
jgi:hypothetical protein